MATNDDPLACATPFTGVQTDLPGIPRGSSLNEILAAYGLTPSEAPDGLRRYRHELLCGDLRAIAEVWVTPGGDVDGFRIWSLHSRATSTKTPA